MVGANKRVLEIGCASGCQSRVLKDDLHCTVTGIEISPAAAEEARQHCHDVIVDDVDSALTNGSLDGKEFDVVLAADVLEHLVDPQGVLERVRALLAPDGYVVASIPNIAHASVIFELMNGRFDYRNYGLLDSTHVRFFTRKAIYRLFESAGYLISQIERRALSPAETEFRTQPVTQEDMRVLDYVRAHNPEWDTYQFAVKAYPADSRDTRPQTALLEVQEQNEILQKELKRMRSKLDWITNRPAYRLGRKLAGIVKAPFKR
jgi:2-polyprenyl-3-methyl-5-hydroxy-6-metoxy-1,4-benzoquinol methylase